MSRPSAARLIPKNLENVFKAAILSRILALAICLGTFYLQSDYDSSSTILHRDESMIYQFLRWDSVYFMDIAENGYRLEQQFAFDFGYPALVALLASRLSFIDAPTIWKLLSSAILISNVSFITAVILFYYLCIELGFRPKSAQVASVMFAFNPASIFMSAAYRESLFSVLSIGGMLLYQKSRFLFASLIFGAASMTRSNGILHAGFFGWNILHGSKSYFQLLKNALYGIVVVLPFVGFQYYGYSLFCQSGSDSPTWCNRILPLITSHVQKYYWNNGFLKYWTVNNIPNFLLASPLIYLNTRALIEYARADFKSFANLGLKNSGKLGIEFNSQRILPYAYLTLAMLVLCVFFMHVQVILRFFASNPFAYWYLDHIKVSKPTLYWLYSRYFVLYGLAAAALFGTFLPPA